MARDTQWRQDQTYLRDEQQLQLSNDEDPQQQHSLPQPDLQHENQEECAQQEDESSPRHQLLRSPIQAGGLQEDRVPKDVAAVESWFQLSD